LKKNEEMLDKKVDSIVAKLMDSSASDSVPEITDNIVVEEPEKSQVTFPYLAYTPLSRKLEIFENKQQSMLEKLQVTSDLNYGTPNPSVPVSQVPCGGCGAHLHCQSPSLPGYLPQEIFSVCDKHRLRSQLCQRCRFLREHNVALNVQISPEDYPKTISIIRDQMAMVILIVDLLDFPGSIWPDLLDIIGHKRPVCVVGNKVDLLPKDSRGYLNHITKCLVQELEKSGMNRANIKHVCLVSAQTGYGIESLITKIQNSWGVRGDVYLLGCTNVGKSSLFNALIGSDFCKTKATDLLERATVSSWPGTTLNL
jgi:GTP-binding protein EngB required for normal cell division